MIDFLIILAFIVYSVANGFRNKSKASENLREYFLAGGTITGWRAGFVCWWSPETWPVAEALSRLNLDGDVRQVKLIKLGRKSQPAILAARNDDVLNFLKLIRINSSLHPRNRRCANVCLES